MKGSSLLPHLLILMLSLMLSSSLAYAEPTDEVTPKFDEDATLNATSSFLDLKKFIKNFQKFRDIKDNLFLYLNFGGSSLAQNNLFGKYLPRPVFNDTSRRDDIDRDWSDGGDPAVNDERSSWGRSIDEADLQKYKDLGLRTVENSDAISGEQPAEEDPSLMGSTMRDLLAGSDAQRVFLGSLSDNAERDDGEFYLYQDSVSDALTDGITEGTGTQNVIENSENDYGSDKIQENPSGETTEEQSIPATGVSDDDQVPGNYPELITYQGGNNEGMETHKPAGTTEQFGIRSNIPGYRCIPDWKPCSPGRVPFCCRGAGRCRNAPEFRQPIEGQIRREHTGYLCT